MKDVMALGGFFMMLLTYIYIRTAGVTELWISSVSLVTYLYGYQVSMYGGNI